MEKGPLAPFLCSFTAPLRGAVPGTGSQYDMSAASYYRLADKYISWQKLIDKLPQPTTEVDADEELEGLFK